MKYKSILSLAVLGLCLCGCGGKGHTSTNPSVIDSLPPHEFVEKEKKGTGVIFDEEQGINTKDATVFEEGTARYVIYQASAGLENHSNVIAARKATKNAQSVWEYGDRLDIIMPATTGWDTNIGNPSVIAGTFAYSGTTYKYLMAYDGNNNTNNKNYQIGLAVSNDILSGWMRVGTNPVITYDSELNGNEYGCGAPSLVSYDQHGKVYMMYSYGETNLANERIVDCDFSNLNAPLIDAGSRQIQVAGLNDGGDQTVLTNADFALDEDGELYLVRDVYPLSGNRPGSATSVEIAHANIGILNYFDKYSWTPIDTITGVDTMDPDDVDSLGWDEIYSGAIVTNEYGVLQDKTKIEIIYSTYNEQEETTDTLYKYSAQLCSFVIENA